MALSPDAQAIARWLEVKAGLPEQNIRLLTSTTGLEKIIKNDVDTEIANLIQEVVISGAAADRLYFYFAGHGMGVENDIENNGLCLSNWTEFLFNSAAMSSADYKKKFVSEGLFKEVVIWLDCCRNTKLHLQPQASPGVNLRGTITQPKWFTGYATSYENLAYETAYANGETTETRGIFTKVLLDGLNGAASQDGGPVDAQNLADYLYINVPAEASKAGFSQMPDISHNTGIGRLLLFP